MEEKRVYAQKKTRKRGKMKIRQAKEMDISRIHELLVQVCLVHHKGRPDLFQGDHNRKYTDEQLREILNDERRPVFVAVDETGKVLGYAFCIFQQYINDNIMTDIKTLYIDDLCVDEECRGVTSGRNCMKRFWNLQRGKAAIM